jgi:hypothetical protein
LGLSDELELIAASAARFAAEGESVAAVLASEPQPGHRVYLCAFARGEDDRAWLALDGAGEPVLDRAAVRDAVSITALCEVAEETAGGGELEELRAKLATLRLTENPPGIDAAEEAALALERVIATPPQLASPARLDDMGSATRRLEQALGGDGRSPFGEAMKLALAAVEALTNEVEAAYKVELR